MKYLVRSVAMVALLVANAALLAQEDPEDPEDGGGLLKEGYCSLCIGPEGDAVWCCVKGGKNCQNAGGCN